METFLPSVIYSTAYFKRNRVHCRGDRERKWPKFRPKIESSEALAATRVYTSTLASDRAIGPPLYSGALNDFSGAGAN